MAAKVDPLEEARSTLIQLLEDDDWRVAASAETDGRLVLSQMGEPSTQYGIIRFVLGLLRKRFPMHPIKLGEPPGSAGTAFVMNNADGKGLYVKLKIEDELAWVLSFHRSKHAKSK